MQEPASDIVISTNPPDHYPRKGKECVCACCRIGTERRMSFIPYPPIDISDIQALPNMYLLPAAKVRENTYRYKLCSIIWKGVTGELLCGRIVMECWDVGLSTGLEETAWINIKTAYWTAVCLIPYYSAITALQNWPLWGELPSTCQLTKPLVKSYNKDKSILTFALDSARLLLMVACAIDEQPDFVKQAPDGFYQYLLPQTLQITSCAFAAFSPRYVPVFHFTRDATTGNGSFRFTFQQRTIDTLGVPFVVGTYPHPNRTKWEHFKE